MSNALAEPEAAPRIPQPGTTEYFTYFSQSNLKPPATPEEVPDFFLEHGFPEAMERFVIDNQTVNAAVPGGMGSPSLSIVSFNARQHVTKPRLPESMRGFHAHVIPEIGRLIVSRTYQGQALYSMTIWNHDLPLNVSGSFYDRPPTEDPKVVVKIAERIARDAAFILKPFVLAKNSEDDVK